MNLRITADPAIDHLTLSCESCGDTAVFTRDESAVVMAAETSTFFAAHRRCTAPADI